MVCELCEGGRSYRTVFKLCSWCYTIMLSQDQREVLNAIECGEVKPGTQTYQWFASLLPPRKERAKANRIALEEENQMWWVA